MFGFIRRTFSKPGDEYQVRIVRKRNGEKLFFPEHRERGVMSSWNTIICVNGRAYKTITTSVVNDPTEACVSIEEAEEYITKHKEAQIILRGEDIAEQEIKAVE